MLKKMIPTMICLCLAGLVAPAAGPCQAHAPWLRDAGFLDSPFFAAFDPAPGWSPRAYSQGGSPWSQTTDFLGSPFFAAFDPFQDRPSGPPRWQRPVYDQAGRPVLDRRGRPVFEDLTAPGALSPAR